MRFLSATFVFVLAACLAGCQGTSEESVSIGEAVSGPLENVNVLDVVAKPGMPVEVGYDPNTYGGTGSALPFLAIPLAASSEAQADGASVHVEGAFPGAPRLVLTDADFNVLAEGKAADSDGEIDRVAVAIPKKLRPAFALVRDDRWVRPMRFVVTLR